jgi:hypothetical protein
MTQTHQQIIQSKNSAMIDNNGISNNFNEKSNTSAVIRDIILLGDNCYYFSIQLFYNFSTYLMVFSSYCPNTSPN